jgi:hypothetical protein
MTITFENDNDIIVYALEKNISHARNNQYMFLAQSVWWISSIIGLQKGLIIHIDNLNKQYNIEKPEDQIDSPKHSSLPAVHPSCAARMQNPDSDYTDSEHQSVSTTETDIHNEVIDNCEAFLEQSKQERKTIGQKTRQASRVDKKKARKIWSTQTEGIDKSELKRRKAAGECQRCAWS